MKTVSQMDNSDIGAFYARKGMYVGLISSVEDVKKEFGEYKVIHYFYQGAIYSKEEKRSSARADIWRLSDGPEEFIGDVHTTLFANDFYARPDLSRFEANGNSRFDLEQDAVGYLINISERELEDHFNSLQFV